MRSAPSVSSAVAALASVALLSLTMLLSSPGFFASSFAPSRAVVVRSSAVVAGRGGRGGNGGVTISSPTREVEEALSTATALPMGLRSFIKGKLEKIKKKGDDDDDADEVKETTTSGWGAIKGGEDPLLSSSSSDDDSSESSPTSPPPPPSAAEFSEAVSKSPPLSAPDGPIRQPLPEDLPPSVARRSGRAGESVQERINRVKAGRMTEREKAAFLRAALSRPMDPRAVEASESDGGEEEDKPSPFPKETLWGTLMGNGDDAVSSAASASKSGGRRGPYDELDDKAKRAYYDMVTDPDRFRRYGYAGPPQEEDGPNEEPLEPFAEDDDYYASGALAEEDQQPNAQDGAGADADDDSDVDSSDPTSGDKSWGGFFDLGSRLEAAAHAKEEEDQRVRAEAEARRLEMERAREEERRKREEEERRRVAEMERLEAEARARRAEEEERERRAEEERRRAEEEKLREMQAAQDAYWASKLEEERKMREQSVSDAERKSKSLEEDKRRMAEKAREEKARAEEEERTRMREEERAREDPHEGEILKEAQMDDLHERERDWQITEKESARVARIQPQRTVPDVSASTFVSEQQRKSDEIARLKKEQEDRLRALNSPLPAAGAAPRYGAAPSTPAARKAAGGSSARQVASLASMISGGGGGKATSAAAPAPAAAPSASPRLSLSEMTRLKKDDGPAASAGGGAGTGGMPSLSEMTRLKKDGTGGNAATAAGGPQRRVRQKLPLSGEAGPSAKGGSRRIRQQLPLGDEADEDDDLLRSGKSKTMSIGDYKKRSGGTGGSKEDEKKRSQMWGIDMDKIL